jgi:hypothetical protein
MPFQERVKRRQTIESRGLSFRCPRIKYSIGLSFLLLYSFHPECFRYSTNRNITLVVKMRISFELVNAVKRIKKIHWFTNLKRWNAVFLKISLLITVECMCRKGLRSSYLSTDTRFYAGRLPELPLKPLWYINFVSVSLFILSLLFFHFCCIFSVYCVLG